MLYESLLMLLSPFLTACKDIKHSKTFFRIIHIFFSIWSRSVHLSCDWSDKTIPATKNLLHKFAHFNCWLYIIECVNHEYDEHSARWDHPRSFMLPSKIKIVGKKKNKFVEREVNQRTLHKCLSFIWQNLKE